ncbi:hypothetical protein QEG98_41180 [Myxococcus sp. MxC21-1]|uniref:hypothetical protein n=1 Tax=Myxococcus sp. MxC21-1 TaxID=3041439 RepID=UPI00292FFFAE|nr:hypothetical protein [Myxococcus sp. MxC21-1]WNZ62155.1 hypothetical protein QEG98_41180 [Myxococcus sp. MxC21-1]
MNSRTLLFLEDDKDLQSLVGTFLREKGYPEALLVWVNQLFPAPALPPTPPPEALEEAEEVNVEVDDLAASLAALNAEDGARLKEKVAALEALLVRGRGGDARLLRAKENGRNRIEA